MRRNTITLKFALVAIGTIAFLFCIFWLPGIATMASELNPEYGHLRLPVLIGVYMTVVPFYIALNQAFKLLGHIERNETFSIIAVAPLKAIGSCSTAIALMYGSGMVFLVMQKALHPFIAATGVFVIFIASAIALFTAVLREMLLSAIAIKSENDLTV